MGVVCTNCFVESDDQDQACRFCQKPLVQVESVDSALQETQNKEPCKVDLPVRSTFFKHPAAICAYILAAVLTVTVLFTGVSGKNKYVGTWDAGPINLVLQKNGVGYAGSFMGTQAVEWKINSDHIDVKTIETGEVTYCRLSSDKQSLMVFTSTESSKPELIMIKK